MPVTVETVRSQAFAGCFNLLKGVEQQYKDQMFRNLTSIQESAFQQIGLDGLLRLNGDLTILEGYAFAVCSEIRQIEFGSNTKPSKLDSSLTTNTFFGVAPVSVTYYITSDKAPMWEEWTKNNRFEFDNAEIVQYSPVLV